MEEEGKEEEEKKLSILSFIPFREPLRSARPSPNGAVGSPSLLIVLLSSVITPIAFWYFANV